MKNKKKYTVFLVDDDPIFLKVLETQFTEQTPYSIKTFSTGEECLNNLLQKPDVIFLDYYLNSTKSVAENGLAILDKIKLENPEIDVIMLSSQDSMSIAINCIRHQAFDYIVKSEASFVRSQKTIATMFYQKKLKKDLSFYKTIGIVASSSIVLLLFGIIVV